MATATITIRTEEEIEAQLSALAEATQRSRNWVIEEALRQYLATQSWQIEGIRDAQESLASGESIPFEEVMTDLQSKIDRRMKAARMKAGNSPKR